jgi:hypothetical protein
MYVCMYTTCVLIKYECIELDVSELLS